MASKKQKAFIAVGTIIAAVIIVVLVVILTSSWSHKKVMLVTSPEGDEFYVPALEPFEITCQGSGDDVSKITNMKWLDNVGRVVQERDIDPAVRMDKGNSLTLVFTSPKIEGSGIYACAAEYKGGILRKGVKIVFYDNGTSGISNVEVSRITSRSVQFTIETFRPVSGILVKFSGEQNSTEYIQHWKYDDNYEVKDLIPGGSYTFRFTTEPSEGKEWSKAYQVTLLTDAPEDILESLEGTSATIQWLRKFDDIIREKIDAYELKYFSVQMEKGGNSSIPSKCAITVQIPNCAGSSYVIADLSQNEYYEVQLRAQTESGYSEPYKQKFFIP